MKISASNWQTDKLQTIQHLTENQTENMLVDSNFIVNQLPIISWNYYLKRRAEETLRKNVKLLKNPISMPTVETVLPNASLTLYMQKLESTFVALYEDSPSTLESIMPYALDLNDSLRACVGDDGFELMRAVAISNAFYLSKNFRIQDVDDAGGTSRWAIITCPQIVGFNVSYQLSTVMTYMLVPYRNYPKELFIGDTPMNEQWLHALWVYRDRSQHQLEDYELKKGLTALSSKALGISSNTINLFPYMALILDPFLRSSTKTLQEAKTAEFTSQVVVPVFGERESLNPAIPAGAVDVSNDDDACGIPTYAVYDADTSSFYYIIPTEPKVWDALYKAFPRIPKRDPLKPHSGDSDVLTDPRHPDFPDLIQGMRAMMIYMGITDVRKYFGKPTDTEPSTYDEWHTFYIKENHSFNQSILKEHQSDE